MGDEIPTELKIIPLDAQTPDFPRPPEPDNMIVEPEWVVSYPIRRGTGWQRWLLALGKALLACLVAYILIAIPIHTSNPIENWKNPIIIFFLIAFLGKVLVDTLFYNHYRP